MVTVKGFNRFVWDFEGTKSENPHGIFASHGAMLIANSEEALKAHDVKNGWDWARIPGATTMSLTVKETRLTTMVDGVEKSNTSPFPAMTPASQSGANPYTILVDTKNISYYIPPSNAPSLKVHVQTQISESNSGKTSSGEYATACLEHSPVNGDYEYAIQVNTPSYPHTAWSLQEEKQQLYEVLKQDDEAHVVKFVAAPDRLEAKTPLYGYVIFQSTSSLPYGPVKAVNKQCRLMV